MNEETHKQNAKALVDSDLIKRYEDYLCWMIRDIETRKIQLNDLEEKFKVSTFENYKKGLCTPVNPTSDLSYNKPNTYR